MPRPIDARIFALYDDYCHSGLERREFLRRAAALGIVGGLGMAVALLPNYARACQVSFTDERIGAEYTRFPSPGGSGEELRGYLVRPQGAGPFPAVVVIHENRGLNPYIEDVARRLAVAGYLALAPDALWAVGGYPGNDAQGKALQAGLDKERILKGLKANVKPNIQRFKGLGEMNPATLKETTLDPRHRTALRVRIVDELETDRILNELMGKDASARFRFIMERARDVDELDV